MANSVQEFRGRYLRLNDNDILAMVAILRLTAGDRSTCGRAPEIFEFWIKAIKESGPGTIDLGLDDIARSEVDKNEFCKVIALLEQKLASYGDVIPASELWYPRDVEEVTFFDYPKSRVIEVARQLKEFVQDA